MTFNCDNVAFEFAFRQCERALNRVNSRYIYSYMVRLSLLVTDHHGLNSFARLKFYLSPRQIFLDWVIKVKKMQKKLLVVSGWLR